LANKSEVRQKSLPSSFWDTAATAATAEFHVVAAAAAAAASAAAAAGAAAVVAAFAAASEAQVLGLLVTSVSDLISFAVLRVSFYCLAQRHYI
jgi:hypothetical protein